MLVVDDKILTQLESLVVLTEDASGLNCPLPILRTKKALAQIEAGQLLKIFTTDKSAVADLTIFSKQTGHTLKAQTEHNNVVTHYIEKRMV